MSLSMQQQDAIDKWFAQHKIAPKCGLCGSNTFKRDIVATLRATDPSNGGDIMSTGPGLLRMLRLTCGTCSGVVMLDATRMGI